MIVIDGWRLEPPYWIRPNGERLTAVGGHWDAGSLTRLADVWQRRHPGA